MAPPQDRVAELTSRYDREARDYRELWAPILRIASLELVAELAHVPARRVVDVAGGVGTLLPDLRAAFPGATIIAGDLSGGMLALAPSEYPRVVIDARQLALASSSVDLALYVFMLFHLDDPLAGLREAHRVLRPGGRIGALTWGGNLESNASRVWNECLDEHGAPPVDPAAAVRHEPVDAPEKMDTLLRAAGFASARCWAGELVAMIESEHLIRLRTTLGSPRPRYDSLAPEMRAACLASARRRLLALGPDDFVARGSVVYAVGSA